MAGLNDFSFDGSADQNANRSTFRVNFSGMYVYIKGIEKLFSVADFSASGFSFKAGDVRFTEKKMISISIVIAKKFVLKGIQAEVVRLLKDNVIACAFREVSRQQEYDLDKLVLEIQKRAMSSCQ